MPVYTGNNTSETINGSAVDDTITGLGGNDSLSGLAGNDNITGGTGNDTLRGGLDSDTLLGGAGHDVIYGNQSDDLIVIVDGEGDDTIYGGTGNDTLSTKGGWVVDMSVGTAWNSLTGATNTVTFQSIESILGDFENDTIYGSVGEDTLNGGGGQNALYGGDGNDVLRVSTSAYVINNASGLYGEGGNDTFYGNGVIGEILSGGAGNDVFVFDAAGAYQSSLEGGDGHDVVLATFSPSISTLSVALKSTFEVEEFQFFGDSGAFNTLSVTPFDAYIQTATIRGGTTVGSIESFVLYLDEVDLSFRMSPVTTSGITFSLASMTFADWGSEDRITLIGTAEGDDLFGSSLDETLTGNGGLDTIHAGGGDDLLRDFTSGYGEAGNDTLEAYETTDNVTIDGGLGDDLLSLKGGGDFGTFYLQGGGYGEDDNLLINGTASDLVFDLRGTFMGGLQELILSGSGGTTRVQFDGTYYNPTDYNFDFRKLQFAANAETVEIILDENENVRNASFALINQATGYAHDDLFRIVGTTHANVLTGSFVADEIQGLIGEGDTLIGGAGDDTISGVGLLQGGSDDDLLQALVSPSVGVSTLQGQDGNDVLEGSAIGDFLEGGAGDDTLFGFDGLDTLRGGDGFDSLVGGGDDDLVDYSYLNPVGAPLPHSGMYIDLAQGTSTFIENLNLIEMDQILNIPDVLGSGYDDVITGDASDNGFTGSGGNDTMNGGVGTDQAIWTGPKFGYAMRRATDGTITIEDRNDAEGDEGTDELTSMEALTFGAETQTAADLLQQTGFAEVGTLTLTDAPSVIMLERSYTNPVVIAYVATTNGAQAVNVRILDIGADTIDLYLQEPNYLNGIHLGETVNYLVVEQGTWVLPDGTLMEAGTLSTNQLSTQTFSPVTFDAEFDATPVILSQVQTSSGSDFVSTRQRHADSSSFEIALQEEEANNSGSHVYETVGWVAFESGTGSAAGFNWSADGVDGVTDAEATLAHGIGGTAVTLAQLATHAGVDPGWTRGNGDSAGGHLVSVEEDQSSDTETSHVAERIDYVTFSDTGLLPALPRQTILETGNVSLTNASTTITLSHQFDNPVVAAYVATRNGADPVHVRVSEIAGDQLSLQLKEPNHLDGTHQAETVTYVVAEAGAWVLPDGTLFEAGHLNSALLTSAGFEAVSFSAGFGSAPVILSQVQTLSGTDFVVTRQKAASATGFEISMQEEEALNSGGHAEETLGWIAIEQGTGTVDGFTWLADQADGVTDADTTIAFGTDLSATANVVAGLGGFSGVDPTWGRGAGFSSTSFTVHSLEDQSLDSEQTHVGEKVDYLAFSSSGTLEGYDLDYLL